MSAFRVTENGFLDLAEDRGKWSPGGLRSLSMGSRLNMVLGTGKSLSEAEQRFLVAAEVGDTDTIRSLLQEHQLNVDFSDTLGRSPLRLAVAQEHTEIVELLLEHSTNTSIREALLQAINNGNDQIAEFILKHLSDTSDAKQRQRFGEEDYFFSQCQEGSQFSSDTTPLILSAWKNRFQIVLILLRQGERIAKPHHCYCGCLDCSNKRTFDELRLAKTRLNAYRGLVSEAYISLSSKDPILEAFQLGRELRVIAEIDKCYKTEYLCLADQLSEYVVKLLDAIRGHDELEVILDKVGSDLEEEEESFELLERFKLAIEYSEKKFVAHPSCQQKLLRIWYKDCTVLERASLFHKLMIGCAIILAYPVLALTYMVAPMSKVGQFLRSPCVKFIGRLMSLLIFMVMIVISTMARHEHHRLTFHDGVRNASLNFIHDTCSEGHLICNFVIRRSIPTPVEILLALWVIGMLWQEMKQMYQAGVRGYFSSLFNYLDTCMICLYLVCFSLKTVCYFKVNQALDYFSLEQSWMSLVNNTGQAREHFYWLVADRFYWDELDPENVLECSFAIANIISFTRICYIFPAHELLGPLQISLVRMAKDILTFIVIFLVLFMAFLVGLLNLYWYYPLVTRHQFELFDHNASTEAQDNFGTLNLTFRTILWTSIGQGDNKAVLLGDFRNDFTQNVGYWIYGAYSVLIVIVLLNMLIAMMTRSFDSIQSEGHTEWKFARSELYMEYIKDDSTLPVPFNIIPTPKFLWRTVMTCYNAVMNREPDQLSHPGRTPDVEIFDCHSNGASYSANKSGEDLPKDLLKPGIQRFQQKMASRLARQETDPNIMNEKLTYKRVMNRIIRRYMFDKHVAECADDEANSKDASNLRFELQSLLSEHKRDITERLTHHDSRLIHLADRLEMMLKQMEPSSGVEKTQSGNK